MFIEINGEIFRILIKTNYGVWLISYENPNSPKFVSENECRTFKRIEPPKKYIEYIDKQNKLTRGQKKRKELIQLLIEDESYILNKEKRNQKVKEIAEHNKTTIRRIEKLYFKYLAGQSLIAERNLKEKEATQEQKIFIWAIDTFYYSAKKMSLRDAYDLMLLSKYINEEGQLIEEYPTWNCFRHFFYDGKYHKKSKSSISRNGLSNYQRNQKPLFSSAMSWKNKIGCFQMDATQADIYLVSRIDKVSIIGRPNIYIAVDTVTQLIAGVYVGLDAGEQAVMNCIANAAMDKVIFCQKYGISITKNEWPNIGLPGEIITDKGKEFLGSRMEELAIKYGIEFQSLPPFRPDRKGLVEKSFDLLQQRYKPILRGKGVIDSDSKERWSIDYRNQAILTLEDFTKIIIHCIVYLNSCRIITNCQIKETLPIASYIWSWYEENQQFNVIPINDEELYQFSLPRKTVVLSRKGINYQGLWYVCVDYKKILESKRMGDSVQILYDTNDISKIYMIDKNKNIPFQLADYCRRYIGMTQKEYNVEKKEKKIRNKDMERLNTEGRMKVFQNIQKIVNESSELQKEKADMKIIRENRKGRRDNEIQKF